MKGFLYLILLVVPALALPAQGGILNYKPNTARPKPEMRVPGLLYTVKADSSEGKRAAAAAELGEFDARLFPDMVPVLIDVLQNDTKTSVRREAAISLGHFPITPAAGSALHHAASNDPAWKVRIHAWASYKIYQLHGYHYQPAAPPVKIVGMAEPPVAHQTIHVDARPAPAASPVVATPPALPKGAIISPPAPQRLPTTAENEGPVLNSQK